MNKVLLIVGLTVLLGGCAWFTQATKDYQTGAATPLVNGEVAPATQAAVISNTVASLPIPFAAPVAMAVGFLGTIFFTWRRGVSIRNNGGAPVATAATSSVTTNGILQDVANIFTGMFTVASSTAPSTTGTVLQRAWKTALATVAAGVATASTIPAVATFLTGHPIIDGIFVTASAGIAAIEKALSAVPVTATVAPAVAA